MPFRWLYKSVRASLRKQNHPTPILHAAAPEGPIKKQEIRVQPKPLLQEQSTTAAAGMESTTTHGEHCPFLNRSDARCSEHFNLDQLDFALEHCFDQYQTCPIYFELLNERQERRFEAAGSPQARIRSPWKGSRTATATTTNANDGRLVQVQIPARYTKQSV